MTPNSAVRITHPLSTSANAHPLDVLKIKSALGVLGHYEAPDWGVSQFPDATLFAAVEKFQRAKRLKVDGILKPGGPTEQTLQASLTADQAGTALHTTAQALQNMGRNGDEILAHISPEEARLLHDITDGGSINPETGLMEFWWGSSSSSFDASADHKGNQASANNSSSYDASSDHKSNQAMATHADDLRLNSGRDGSPLVGAYQLSTQPTNVAITENKAKKAQRKRDADAAIRARRALTRQVTTPDSDPSFTTSFFEKREADEIEKLYGPTPPYSEFQQTIDSALLAISGINPREKRPYPKFNYNGIRG